MYGEIKSMIFANLPLTNDATIIVLGLSVWLVAGLVFRLPMTRLIALTPVMLIGAGIEVADTVLLGQVFSTAVHDFLLFFLPAGIIVFFQERRWVRV